MAHCLLVERDGGGCAGLVSPDRTGDGVAMSEKSLLEVDLARRCDRQFFPSPAAWEGQALYFLMLDRFSEGDEQVYRVNCRRRVGGGTTQPLQPRDPQQ